MVAHIVVTLFSSYLIFLAWPGSSLFSWHPTLMTVAFVMCMTEALLVFNPQSSLVAGAARMTKSYIHKILQICSLTFATLGFLAIFFNKSINDKPHFTTWHSWLGAATLAFLPFSALWGSSVYYPWMRSFIFRNSRLGDLKIQHATGGLVTYSLACFTIMLAFYSTWFTSVCDGVLWYACKGCLSCLLIIIMNQVTSEYLPRAFPQKTGSQPNKVAASKPSNENTVKISAKKVKKAKIKTH